MILTPHAIVGATLANIFPNDPFLGFSLAFASHYILDIVPHVEYKVTNFLDEDTKTIKSIFKSAGSALHFLFIILDLFIAVFLCILFFVRDEKSAMITFIGLLGVCCQIFFNFFFINTKVSHGYFLRKIMTNCTILWK